MHAAPINGVPLIECHPITYCKNLTTLYRGYGAVYKFQRSNPGVESVIIVLSDAKWWMVEIEAEERLLHRIGGFSKRLNTNPCSGSD